MTDVIQNFSTIELVRNVQPIIHCITNYVTANDVANIVLAAGASPIMADGVREAEDIASVSHGLVLNLGTLRETAVEAMLLAGKKGVELGHPIVLDPVGAAAAAYRRETALRILKEIPCSVIRGNASEIRAIAREMSGTGDRERENRTNEKRAAAGGFDSRGVDSSAGSELTEDNRQETVDTMQSLSRRTGAVIVMTGETDVVADGRRVCMIKNGCSMMRRITGSGCMMDGVIAAFLAAGACKKKNTDRERVSGSDIFQTTVYAAAAMGICGELAYEKTVETGGGTASFRNQIIDSMSLLTDETIRRKIRIET